MRGLIALGHSALTGEGSDPARPGQEARENSWATGTNPEVNSIYLRLVALRPETEGQVANAAEAGAPASRLAGQARTALASVPAPQLVIIQSIDGDIRCDGTDGRHVPEFGAALMAALEVITEASPDTRILILSQAGRPASEAEALADEPEIRRSFGGTGMCYFFDPNGDLVPERLATLTGIIEQYEAEQVRVCSMFPQCTTDNGVMTTYVREQEHLIEGDWNHLGVRGQAALAELIWPTVAELLELPSAAVSDGEDWVVFQSLADEFEPGADDDGVGHDDTIFLARTDGTDLHRLAPDDFVGSEIRPTWSPDGQQIAFLRAQLPNDESQLWKIKRDGSGAERLYTCEAPCITIDYPDWSPDGRAIYFQRDSNPPPEGGPPLTFEIWRYDLATGEATPVLTREDGMSVEQPRISPDGTQVVYVRCCDVETGEPRSALFVADLQGGPESQLTDWDPRAFAYPDWSNTGRIVFNSFDLRVFPETTEAANLYSVAADGSDLQQLTRHERNDTRATQPRWTTDGLGIVYTLVTRSAGDPFGERHLAYIDADGTNARLLTPQPIVGTHPELRPLAQH